MSPSTEESRETAIRTYLPVIAAALGRLEQLDVPPRQALDAGDSLTADLGLASLDIMKLTLELENALDIRVDERAEFEIQTVGELCLHLDLWVREQHGRQQ